MEMQFASAFVLDLLANYILDGFYRYGLQAKFIKKSNSKSLYDFTFGCTIRLTHAYLPVNLSVKFG
ncbi:MAG: hypothetical protein EAZ28_02655 [Oscillatoriales cyanobacterium]|nr:MAG: hypothetical protein EAZ28_02655 [Oscillatoriales cyanobacterium]